MSTAKPDFGLRPVLGLSLLTPNEPNPRSSIRSPAASARVIDSITSLTICSAHRRSTSGKRFAISSIKSDLVMLRILRVAFAIFQWQRPRWRRQYVPVRPPCNNPDVNQKDPGRMHGVVLKPRERRRRLPCRWIAVICVGLPRPKTWQRAMTLASSSARIAPDVLHALPR